MRLLRTEQASGTLRSVAARRAGLSRVAQVDSLGMGGRVFRSPEQMHLIVVRPMDMTSDLVVRISRHVRLQGELPRRDDR